MPFSETEARIRRLLDAIQFTRADAASTKQAALRLAQDAAGLNQVGADFSSLCTTTLQGRVRGNTGVLLGATITLSGPTTGNNYGTYTADGSGLFTAAVQIDASDTTLHAVFGGFGSRFSSTATTVNFTACVVNDWSTEASLDIQGTPAAAYTSISLCNLPIPRLLNTTDSVFGAGTTAAGVWVACYQVTSQAVSGCASVSTPLRNVMSAAGAFLQNFAKDLSGCPTATTNCGLASTSTGLTWSRTALTCPTSGASAFSVTFTATAPSGHLFYPAGTVTFTLYE